MFYLSGERRTCERSQAKVAEQSELRLLCPAEEDYAGHGLGQVVHDDADQGRRRFLQSSESSHDVSFAR